MISDSSIYEDKIKKAEEIEARKEEKKRIRLEKQKQGYIKQRNKLVEKLIAPIILLITVLVSLALMLLS